VSRRTAVRALGALLVLLACRSAPPPPAPIGRVVRDRRAADDARDDGAPQVADVLYRQAAAEAHATDRRDLAADAEYRQGLSRLAAGDAVGAERILEAAATDAQRAGAPALAARAHLALARARQDRGGAELEPVLRLALAEGEAARDPLARALALVGLAALADDPAARGLLDQAEGLAGQEPAVACPLRLQRARRAERAGAPAGELFRAAAAALAAGWRPAARRSLCATVVALRRGGREAEAALLERELAESAAAAP